MKKVDSSSVESWSNISPTTLNRMMATASLIIPSPNTIEKSLGYLVGLIMVRAATESDAQIVALYLTMRAVVNFTYKLKSDSFLIHPKLQFIYLISLLKM